MSNEDDAASRAHKYLAVRRSTAVAKIDHDAIDALLKEAAESTQAKPRPVATRPQEAPVQNPVPEPPRSAPLAVAAQPKASAVAVQSKTPGVTAEVLPPSTPAQGGHAAPNITVVVNTPAPVVHPYPWWGWWGYPYHPVVCPTCGGRPGPCHRWRCPY